MSINTGIITSSGVTHEQLKQQYMNQQWNQLQQQYGQLTGLGMGMLPPVQIAPILGGVAVMDYNQEKLLLVIEEGL